MESASPQAQARGLFLLEMFSTECQGRDWQSHPTFSCCFLHEVHLIRLKCATGSFCVPCRDCQMTNQKGLKFSERVKDLTVSNGLRVKNLQHFSSEKSPAAQTIAPELNAQDCCRCVQPALFGWCFTAVRDQCEMSGVNILGGHFESLHMNPDP